MSENDSTKLLRAIQQLFAGLAIVGVDAAGVLDRFADALGELGTGTVPAPGQPEDGGVPDVPGKPTLPTLPTLPGKPDKPAKPDKPGKPGLVPRAEILAPVPGAVLPSGTVGVRYRVTGDAVDVATVVVSLDGQKTVVPGSDGTTEFTDVGPGLHRVWVEPADAGGTLIPGANTSVDFTVEAAKPVVVEPAKPVPTVPAPTVPTPTPTTPPTITTPTPTPTTPPTTPTITPITPIQPPTTPTITPITPTTPTPTPPLPIVPLKPAPTDSGPVPVAGAPLAKPTVTKAGWATIGLALPKGALPAGLALLAGSYPTQTDVKTTWDDKSARFVVVTCNATATGPVPLISAAPPTGSFVPKVPAVAVTLTVPAAVLVTPAKAPAKAKGETPAPTGTTTTTLAPPPKPVVWTAVSVPPTTTPITTTPTTPTVPTPTPTTPTTPPAPTPTPPPKPVVWTASLPATVSSDLWLDGPQVREWRQVVTPVDPAGKPHPFLRVIFDVRVYQNGSTRLDVTVENCLDLAGATAVTYDVTITAAGQSRFYHAALTHPWMTRWRQVLGSGLTEAQVTPDFEPFYAAGALPRYLPLIANWIDKTEGPTFDILGKGFLNSYMGDVGGRPEIAPYPDWAARYLVHKDPVQRATILACGDLGGSWPLHLREPEGGAFKGVGAGRLISIDQRPEFWLDSRAKANGPAGDLGATGPLTPDIAHQPSLAYIPYLLTGDRYYADEMAFWANYNLIGTWMESYYKDSGRGGSLGLLRSNQTRGLGWGLRNLADPAATLPDGEAMRAYLAAKVRNNLDWLEDYAVKHVTPLGTVFENRPETKTNPPFAWAGMWEQDYLAWAIDHTNKQGFVGGLTLRDKIARFHLKLFTSDPDYPREYAGPYTIPVGEWKEGATDWSWFTSMRQVWEHSLYHGVENGQKVVYKPHPFAGYYGPEARLVLIIALREGWPRAREAYDFLWPKIGVEPFINGIPDLAARAGWAIAEEKQG